MDYLIAIEEVLREARLRVLKSLRRADVFKIVGRGAAGDKTMLIDKLAEDAVISLLSERFKSFTVVSEETGVRRFGEGELIAVLDPLDGSTNALRGFPFYSISLALADGMRLENVKAAGVIDIPRGSLYTASKRYGSRLNGEPIRVSKSEKLEESVVGIDLNVKGVALGYVSRIAPVVERAYTVRFMGSNALGLCMVASGVYDAFVDLRGILRVLDSAAGIFIVEEAGGIILNQLGRKPNPELTPRSRISIVAASTRRLAAEILRLASEE
ncbi:TPA: hypothetical protein EYP27_01120 [Candidatus Bathyarchaeota archaeon]|nr:hypothetical protein [Candidatus Bathyarchaeota archaeon]